MIRENNGIINLKEWNFYNGWTEAKVLLSERTIYKKNGELEDVIKTVANYLMESHGLDGEQALAILEGFNVYNEEEEEEE